MSRLADPSLCPDCRARVGPDAVCTGCGLTLTGPLAARLWRTMLAADDLVIQLRTPVAAAAPAPPVPTTGALPAFPAALPRPAGAPARLSGRAVPVVLLGVGGLFVLVAVSLFLAVTWTVLPLAAKAVLMLALTGVVTTAAVTLTRRGLRGASETFWALVAGLITLDLGAAWRSGLLGLDAAPGRAVAVAVGLLLVVLGLAVAPWARRTPVARCVAAEATVVLGALGVATAGLWTGPLGGGTGQAAGAVLLGGAGAVLLPRLRETALGLLALAVGSWGLLVLVGVAEGLFADSRADYWSSLGSWQLPLGAVLAAGAALPRRVPLSATSRTVAAGGALAGLGGYVLLPGEADALQWLLLAAVTVVLAVLTATAHPTWARAAAALGGLVVLGTVGTTLLLPVGQVTDLLEGAPTWSGPVDLAVGSSADAATWPLLVLLAASYAVVTAARPLLGAVGATTRRIATAALPGLAGLAGAAALLASPAPLWLVVVVLSSGGGVCAAVSLRAAGPVQAAVAALGAETLLLALAAASISDLLTAVLATVLALGGTAVLVPAERAARGAVAAGCAAVVVLTAGYAALGWALAVGGDDAFRAVLLAGVASAFWLGAPYAVRLPATRLTIEATAVVPALAALAVALGDHDLVALVLTVLGSALALVSVLRRDRQPVGWAASAVLAVATLSRVVDTPTGAPEVYALPAAAVLLGAGLLRLRGEPERGTWSLLGAGLSLALGPSLVLALPDPESLRALLVGLGALAALALGAVRRWQAPLLVGAAALVVLGLRFLGPLAADVLADPLGAWMLFGAAGSALLCAGVLWEQSLGRLRSASRYLTELQ